MCGIYYCVDRLNIEGGANAAIRISLPGIQPFLLLGEIMDVVKPSLPDHVIKTYAALPQYVKDLAPQFRDTPRQA